jgi:hypothetical protein
MFIFPKKDNHGESLWSPGCDFLQADTSRVAEVELTPLVRSAGPTGVASRFGKNHGDDHGKTMGISWENMGKITGILEISKIQMDGFKPKPLYLMWKTPWFPVKTVPTKPIQ